MSEESKSSSSFKLPQIKFQILLNICGFWGRNCINLSKKIISRKLPLNMPGTYLDWSEIYWYIYEYFNVISYILRRDQDTQFSLWAI